MLQQSMDGDPHADYTVLALFSFSFSFFVSFVSSWLHAMIIALHYYLETDFQTWPCKD
jgi:hypothetical protein